MQDYKILYLKISYFTIAIIRRFIIFLTINTNLPYQEQILIFAFKKQCILLAHIHVIMNHQHNR